MSLFDARPNFRPFQYNTAYELWNDQINHPWTPDKIDVRADVQNYHTEFTEAEKHGVNTVLKLFTTYETHVEDYWTEVIYKWFKPFEIRMMASAFASMESVHAVFYDKLNDALNLSTKEFYTSFAENEAMKSRVEFIEEQLKVNSKEDLPISLAAFAFVEGVVLYSSFAFLLSFPKRNKLTNVSNGIAYSVRDENLHAIADCWLFNTLVEELQIPRSKLRNVVKDIARKSYEVECLIIDEIFAKGEIADITKEDLKVFVQSRINKKLADMKFKPIYKINKNPIGDWFYVDINTQELSDFFATNPTEYAHKWGFHHVKW